MSDLPKSDATFFKEEIEQSLRRYPNMTVYETIGALEVVKQNMLERLGMISSKKPPESGDERGQ